MTPDSELLTSPQVSRLLDVSIRTVHRRAEAGELTPVQKLPGPNGAYLFRRADVEEFMRRAAAAAVEPAR